MGGQAQPANDHVVELAVKISHQQPELNDESKCKYHRGRELGALFVEVTNALNQEKGKKRDGGAAQDREHQGIGLVGGLGEEKIEGVLQVAALGGSWAMEDVGGRKYLFVAGF